MDIEESESKKSKVSESRKRQSETDIRDLDVERSQRDEEAQASGSGQKRAAEDSATDDSESRRRLGVLEEVGARAPADLRILSLNLLDQIYKGDLQDCNHKDYELVLNALKSFGD